VPELVLFDNPRSFIPATSSVGASKSARIPQEESKRTLRQRHTRGSLHIRAAEIVVWPVGSR